MGVLKKPPLGFFFLNGHPYFVGMRDIYTSVRMECEESIFPKQGWLATWLSREFKPWANLMASLDFCPVVLQPARQISFSACFTRVHLLAACQSRATSKIQSRVLDFTTQSWTFFHTLSHTTLTWFPPKYRISKC